MSSFIKRTSEPEKFYLSTAINYTNGPPHLGHAYEAIVGDCITRYHRMMGKNVFFLTGSDEHGQKIADTAASKGLTPKELCDQCVEHFQTLNRRLNISNDAYIRTTDFNHENLAQQFWKRVASSGDIYLGSYEGWYSKREERFLTETEAKAHNYMDGEVALTKTKESSYFFKMSRYQERIVDHITTHPEFVFPSEKRNEILERLKEPLLDLSISRTSFDWGIPIPDEFEGRDPDEKAKHVMYVWFDALTNYLSGVEWSFVGENIFWPANIHLIGKDIAWFHAVVWPTMLFSAGITLPKQIVCHGFINGPDDRKMSKSWGNVVDPMDLCERYSNSDVIRYFLLRDGSFGSDLSFNEYNLRERHDSELAAGWGNLVSRALAMTKKWSDNRIPVEDALPLPFSIIELSEEMEKNMKSFQIHAAILNVFARISVMNEWLVSQSPWSVKEDSKKRQILRTVLDGVYILAHFLLPFIPQSSARVIGMMRQFTKSDISRLCFIERRNEEVYLWPDVVIEPDVEPLFPRIGLSRFEKKM